MEGLGLADICTPAPGEVPQYDPPRPPPPPPPPAPSIVRFWSQSLLEEMVAFFGTAQKALSLAREGLCIYQLRLWDSAPETHAPPPPPSPPLGLRPAEQDQSARSSFMLRGLSLHPE